MARRITILGSTGSIGESTLDLIRRAAPGEFQIAALTANTNSEALAAQAIEFSAEFVAIADAKAGADLRARLAGTSVNIGVGEEALIEAGQRPADFTMAAIIGAAGLKPTLAAVDQGNHVGLANKECLVCAGDLFMQRVAKSGAKLLPVDSEHNAIFQVLETEQPKGVRRLILTASGGPFLDPDRDLAEVTLADALKHPTWTMGSKITIDSATLMNKGLELIEASYLFERPSSEIDVVIHPQSIIHSMVEYIDGSVLAQLGSPDMRTPIAYALGWPKRMEAPVERLDLTKLSGLTFFEPDTERFPALRLARDALMAGGQGPNVLNAANEVAVAEFLQNRIAFTDIPDVVARTLAAMAKTADFAARPDTVEGIVNMDMRTRATAHSLIHTL